MNIALVHDWLNQRGGAERVLEHLVDFFPEAPLYTSMYWRDGMPPAYRTWDIRTTWMDCLPGIYRHHQLYFPFYALTFALLDLRGTPNIQDDDAYDIVLSNKSGFCHGTRTGHTPHLCYCLAPTRYVWEFETYAAREAISPGLKVLLKPMVAALRRWDYRVAQRSTLRFIAISTEIQQRIRRYYGRESVIIAPPVDTARYTLGNAGASGMRDDDYYLIVSRLIPYKRIDLAVRAFNQLGLPLVIAGSGRDRDALRAMAASNITFLGYVPDAALPDLLAGCKAFIFPGREDFGMTPVEAQAAGRPVIAYGEGGALDTVIDGRTGTFFYEQTPEALAEAVLTFDVDAVDAEACRRNAQRFSVARFRREMVALIGDTLNLTASQVTTS